MEATRSTIQIDSLPFGLIGVDQNGTVVLVNSAVEQVVGSPTAGWRGRALADCLEQAIPDRAQVLCWTVALGQALAQRRTIVVNFPIDPPSAGSPPPSIMGAIAPWDDAETRQAGALVILQSESRVRDSSQGRNRLFAMMSHELGSPVTNIAAAAGLLAQHLSGAPRAQQQLLAIIQDEAARSRRMLSQFLTASSDLAGTARPARYVVTLRPLLARVARTFGVRADGHRLVLRIAPDVPFVEGDADRIQEVVCNLIDNAARYSPPDSPIVLAAEARRDDVLISVADEGRGVPDGDEERIFEPFYRGRFGQAEEGLGVGLHIARTLARALGGELWYEQQPGQGARFCFTLARAAGLAEDEGDGVDGRESIDR